MTDKKKLKRACWKNDFDTVKHLCEKGVDIHFDEELPLQTACLNDNVEIAKYLIEQGANIHVKDNFIIEWCEDLLCEKINKFFKESNIFKKKKNSICENEKE